MPLEYLFLAGAARPYPRRRAFAGAFRNPGRKVVYQDSGTSPTAPSRELFCIIAAKIAVPMRLIAPPT